MTLITNDTADLAGNKRLSCHSPGFMLGVILNLRAPEQRPLLFYVGSSLGLLLTALLLKIGLEELGFDLSWRVLPASTINKYSNLLTVS